MVARWCVNGDVQPVSVTRTLVMGRCLMHCAGGCEPGWRLAWHPPNLVPDSLLLASGYDPCLAAWLSLHKLPLRP